MKQRVSSEANRSLASQEIPHILSNSMVHYRIHKRAVPIPILRQINPVHTSPSYLLKIHFNIILFSTPGSFKWSLSLRSPHQNTVCTSPPYVLHSPPISFFLILSSEQYLVSSSDHKATLHVVFSTVLLSHPSQAQISSSASYSQAPSAYVLPSV